MIKLNFIPEAQRKQSMKIAGEDFGGVPGEIVVGGLAAIAAALLLIHGILGGVALYKLASYKVFEVRWNAMAGDKKVFDDLSNELKGLQTKMNALRPITSAQELLWSELLNDISDSVPKGVWLREVLLDNGMLTIYGSVVSKMKNEMVEAGNFVAALKERPTISKYFTGVDVDSIQRRENSAVSVADFSLKIRRRK
jgi:hypothetical protein